MQQVIAGRLKGELPAPDVCCCVQACVSLLEGFALTVTCSHACFRTVQQLIYYYASYAAWPGDFVSAPLQSVHAQRNWPASLRHHLAELKSLPAVSRSACILWRVCWQQRLLDHSQGSRCASSACPARSVRLRGTLSAESWLQWATTMVWLLSCT